MVSGKGGQRRFTRLLICGLLLVALVSWDLVSVPRAVGAPQLDPASELEPLPSEEAPKPEREMPAGDPSNPPPTQSELIAELKEKAPGTPEDPKSPATCESLDACVAGKEERFDKATSVELEEFTSPTEQVFRNEDDSYTARVSSVPTRFKDGSGQWTDINLDLEPAPDGGFKVKASGLPVQVLDKPTEGLVRVETPAGPVTVSAPDVAPDLGAPKPEGSKAHFEGPGAAADVNVQLTVDGFEQDLVVADASGPSSYRFTVTLPEGITTRGRPDDGVEFVDAAGTVIGLVGGGQAYDSSGPLARLALQPVTTRFVEQVGASATVEVSVDPAWMADPARVFPVTIDPYYFFPTDEVKGTDTFINQGCSTCWYGDNPNLLAGTYGSPMISYLWFNIGGWGPAPAANLQIIQSNLTVYNWASVWPDAGHPMCY